MISTSDAKENTMQKKISLTWHADSGLPVDLVPLRADATAGGDVEDEAPGLVADAPSGDRVHHEAEVLPARYAHPSLVESVPGRTDALLPLVQDEAAPGRAGLDGGAL